MLAAYQAIPTGMLMGTVVPQFHMKATPVTNAEWNTSIEALGENRYVLLHHDWNTGVSKLIERGPSYEAIMKGPVLPGRYIRDHIGVPDRQHVLILGAQVLVNLEARLSNDQHAIRGTFKRDNQPLVGVAYFQAMAWCLTQTILSGGEYVFDLPTDLQYQYVASHGGTKAYGTETGELCRDGKKLAHLDVHVSVGVGLNRTETGQTVDVDDPKYKQVLPFGVQSTGNAQRWIRANTEYEGEFAPFGLRGGSWHREIERGLAITRGHDDPIVQRSDITFQPTVRKRG